MSNEKLPDGLSPAEWQAAAKVLPSVGIVGLRTADDAGKFLGALQDLAKSPARRYSANIPDKMPISLCRALSELQLSGHSYFAIEKSLKAQGIRLSSRTIRRCVERYRESLPPMESLRDPPDLRYEGDRNGHLKKQKSPAK